MKTLVYLVCVASAVALAFAQQNTNANASASPITPADEAAIRALSKAFEQACNDKAWAKAVAIFADDSIWMPPHTPSITGRPAVEAFLRGFPAFKDLWIEPLEIYGRSDLAYVRGRYACVWLPPGQPEQRDAGKYAEIWRKQADGKWSYLRGVFNTDLPPVAAGGTATPAGSARPPAAETPSVTKALPAGDIEAIRAGANALMKAINDKAWPAAARLFSENGIIHPPNGRAVIGRPAIETWMRAYPPARDLQLELLEIEGRGDFAYVRGRYSIVVLPPNQPEQADSGKFIELWRKQPNGAWKLDRDIFNSDLPVPASPGQGTSATATADPWLGSWVLNLAKTRINPGPAPRSETRTYTATANGERATYDEVQADGKRVYSTSLYRFDGQDAKVVGDPDSHTQAITRTSPRSIASIIKKDGKVVRTATREVSADGKSLTVEFKGTNAKGQRIVEEKWIFDRRDEPWLGAWELNAAKSRIAASAKPKFDFRTFTPTAGGEHAVYVTIESDGKPTRSECHIVYDGSDQPVIAGEPGETLAFTRASARSLAVTSKQNGRVVSTGTRTVSADGNVLTVIVKHVERGEEAWVLERRAADMTQDNVAAAIKAAVATHWHAINGGVTATIDRQHTADISVFLSDVEPRMLFNSPAWLAMLPRWQGAKANWTLRDVEVQLLGTTAAAASFYMDGSVRWADGRVDSRPRRVTEIWVNENGTWKEAHHHDSVYTANP